MKASNKNTLIKPIIFIFVMLFLSYLLIKYSSYINLRDNRSNYLNNSTINVSGLLFTVKDERSDDVYFGNQKAEKIKFIVEVINTNNYTWNYDISHILLKTDNGTVVAWGLHDFSFQGFPGWKVIKPYERQTLRVYLFISSNESIDDNILFIHDINVWDNKTNYLSP